ncbi:Uncharacterised protein [Neisseria meningitidis]|nr:Uncharacterised protein [Neisseria meningitidis]
MVRLFAQNLHAQRMERANRQPARLRLGQHFGDALLHFRGGFIGKGNRGNGMRQIADIDNQILDFLRNHAGFAAASAGEDEQGTAEVTDGFELLGIEFHHVLMPSEISLRRFRDSRVPHGGRIRRFAPARSFAFPNRT